MASEFNQAFQLHNMIPGPAGVATVQVVYNGEDGILDCYGTTVPTAANTFAEGCTFRKVNASSNDTLYVNNGTYASPSFELVLSSGNVISEIDADHLADTAGSPGPSPLLWDDAPLLEVMLNPEKGYFLFEDFNNSLTETDVAATLTQTTGSGTFTDDPTVAGGVSVLDNAANTANVSTNLAFLAMQVKPGVGTHIFFEARVQVGVDDGGILIGLHDDSSTDPLTATINVNTDHAVFFRDEGVGAAAMGTQACDGTNVTSSDTSITDVDKDAYETFGIHIFGDGNTAGDYVKFYHEGVLVATVTDADGGGDDGVPDAVICPTFSIDNVGDTTQMLARIDWMRILCYNATAGTARA